jgi:hypothetical protein
VPKSLPSRVSKCKSHISLNGNPKFIKLTLHSMSSSIELSTINSFPAAISDLSVFPSGSNPMISVSSIVYAFVGISLKTFITA